MSSPLDARIRHIAREEASGMFTNVANGAPRHADTDRVAELEKQLSALTARVDELEKTAAPAPAARPATRRTASEPGE